MSSGPPEGNKLRAAALQALQRRRYEEAAELLERHLAEHPQDAEAELELGLAEMLLGRREQFAARQRSLAARFAEQGPITRRARQLWLRHVAVADSMAKAAAILVLAGIPATAAGCAKQAPTAAGDGPVTTAEPTVEVPAAPPAEESASGAGGVASGEEDGATAAPASASASATGSTAASTTSSTAPTIATATKRPRPKNRYVVARPMPVPNPSPPPSGGGQTP